MDESARADSGVGAEAGTWWSKLADAVMDMARTAVAHIDAGPPGGADRHLVHLIRHGEQVRTLDGTPLHRATAERICCDTATVTHLFGPGWEPLAQGRKTKQWTTAQRRAARIRDGGTCRFPGCHRRIADLHHQQWWSQQGPTDITNGFLACDRHHTLLHHGYHTTGNPNHALTFHRPDGTAIGTTTPQLSRTLATV